VDESSRKRGEADFITKVYMKAGLHSIRMALGNEKFTVVMTMFGLYEYMIMPFGLTNALPTLQRRIIRILRQVLGLELLINTWEDIYKDGGMVVVAYIDNILIATKVSVEKHHQQVGKVFQLFKDNDMCIEIDKCVFDSREVPFLGFIVSGCKGIRLCMAS